MLKCNVHTIAFISKIINLFKSSIVVQAMIVYNPWLNDQITCFHKKYFAQICKFNNEVERKDVTFWLGINNVYYMYKAM